MTSIHELIGEIRQWGEAKGITGANGKGTLLGQLSKTQEELTETRDAAIKYLVASCKNESAAYKEAMLTQLADGIGDAAVTLILAAEMAGLCFEDCLQAAYDEIKGHTGTMVGGVFVREK